ncbi:MAG: PRC-barrel domain-containing protein [Anaerolineae bacterium]|jgi:sporulation protein YlmC with PRC-barrel domain|nr:PRC-barrel domain-containing protein [Anaerolineae bacterium]
MITSKDHANKLIISITDGKKLGEIRGLYVDPEMRQIAAIHLGTEGIINRKTLIILHAAVQVFGADAWLVSGSNVVTTLEETTDSVALTLINNLRGREVQTEGGTKLGVIEDVILDGEARVLGFALGKVYAQGPLAEKKAIVREAITDFGSKDKPMIAVLAQAEALDIPTA